jgi:protein SCO1/2
MPVRSKFLSIAFICVIALAGVAASLIWHRSRPGIELTTGTLFTPPRPLPEFSLIDQRGLPFGSARLLGHWSVLFFGYTNCPDFCPTTLTSLAAVEQRLRAAKTAGLPQVIFVSVDAKRDTPAQLAKYVPYFDPDFIGLTAADQPAIEALARRWGVGVIIQPTPDGNYSVDHSAAIFVVNPAGKLAAILTGPFSTESLRVDLLRIMTGRA